MGEDKKNSNAKVIWYVLFAIVTVILCYLFIVVYFYYISPNNISAKLIVWPFSSNQQIGQMYLDATVEIDFTVTNEVTFEEEEKQVVGINVREDGYVVAPYHDFCSCTPETTFQIYTNSGRVYGGKLLYGDEDFSLAIIKLENVLESEGRIKLPYVSIASSSSSILYAQSVLAISTPCEDNNVWQAVAVENDRMDVYSEINIDNRRAVDYVLEDCYVLLLEEKADAQFSGGPVLNTSGDLLGLANGGSLENGQYVVIPADKIRLVLADAVEAYQNGQTYQNELADNLVGFDHAELDIFIDVSTENSGQEVNFWFDGAWHVYTDEMTKIYYLNTTPSFYVLEDWTYNGETILNAGDCIFSVSSNGNTYLGDKRANIMQAFYGLDEGDTVTVYYQNVNNLDDQLLSKTITV